VRKLLVLLSLGLLLAVTSDSYIIGTTSITLDNIIRENLEATNVIAPVPVEVAKEVVKVPEPIKSTRVPYGMVTADIQSEIGIMIDFYTGDVLYAKNPDKYWTAASLSKLFLLYHIMEKVEQGELDLDAYVDVDEDEWLEELPLDAAVMFLEVGQRVTYRQILQGLGIVSGNDAAYFAVYQLFGGRDKYARTVNDFFSMNGFDQMHLEEPSGLSGFNRITARQFAEFCKLYIDKYEPLLADLHSLKSFSYPLKKNLVEGVKYQYKKVTRSNTNKLLGNYQGVDGLKTGFIKMSGYNYAVTAEREGERLIIVLLGGKGNTAREGRNKITRDAVKLFNKGFDMILNPDR